MQMVRFHQPTMRTLIAARRVFWRHRPEFERMTERQRTEYLTALERKDPTYAVAMRGIFGRNLKSR